MIQKKLKFDILASVSNERLADHLGVHRNRIPDLADRFGLTKHGKGWRPLDVFRKVHALEPLLLSDRLSELQQAYCRPARPGANTDDGTPGSPGVRPGICYLPELAEIEDLATTLWDQGLIRIRSFAGEYGYSYDTFRKKLKTGKVTLPPAAPIRLSSSQHMYRPLDILLWTRHRIALELPAATIIAAPKSAATGPAPAPGIPAKATPEAMTTAVFASAIAAEQGGAG